MEFIISSDFHNSRLDTFIRKTYRNIPISGIFKMIRKGNVKVNKKRKKQNYRLQQGDYVRVWEPSLPTAAKAARPLSKKRTESIKRCIVYEDENILVCNKPSGMVMHAGSNHHHGLSELIFSYTGNPQCTFVHRIDKMTSGLVMASKNLQTTRELSNLIRERAVEKTYAIIVHGEIRTESFILRSFLKTEETGVRVHPDNTRGAKYSKSSFSVIQVVPEKTLLNGVIHTGRKHQLRVQLAEFGHPIVGDMKYGKPDERSEAKGMMFLFAQSIKIPALNLHINLDLPDTFTHALGLHKKGCNTKK